MARTKYPFKVNNVDMPCPSKFEISYQDVSAADSGRVESALMYKNRVAQKVKISLEWLGVSDANAATILTAFDPEYVDVTFHEQMQDSGFFRSISKDKEEDASATSPKSAKSKKA